MRVLFFNEGNLGSHVMGQGQLTQALQTGLAGISGFEARFAGLTEMGRVTSALASRSSPALARSELDMRHLRWQLVQSARARASIELALRREPVDAIHLHSQSVSFAMGSRMRRTPTAISIDTTIEEWIRMPAWRSEHAYADKLLAPSRALERRSLTGAAITLAWTRWAQRAAERTAPGAHVIEHHPGLDLLRYQPAPRRPRERPRVLFVGGRFREKGGEDLLEALAGSLGESVELDLVTPAPVAERPGVRVHRLGPGDPELLGLYQQADVMCLPSYGDAAPWAVLEAMACGTAVLAGKVGGIPDLLDDGRAGVLVDFGAPRQLGEALRRLLGDEPRRAELGARARARCELRFDARVQIPKLVAELGGLSGR